MKLNHINLIVWDVAAAVHLFTTCFGFTCTETKGENVLAILVGQDGFLLILMKDKSGEARYPTNFHIGFMLQEKSEVTAVHEALTSQGYEAREPGKIREEFGFYLTFQNLMIEVACPD